VTAAPALAHGHEPPRCVVAAVPETALAAGPAPLPVLFDPRGRRRARLRWLALGATCVAAAWLLALVLGGLGVGPLAGLPLARSVGRLPGFAELRSAPAVSDAPAASPRRGARASTASAPTAARGRRGSGPSPTAGGPSGTAAPHRPGDAAAGKPAGGSTSPRPSGAAPGGGTGSVAPAGGSPASSPTAAAPGASGTTSATGSARGHGAHGTGGARGSGQAHAASRPVTPSDDHAAQPTPPGQSTAHGAPPPTTPAPPVTSPAHPTKP
jgi:hypothetical protein